MLSVADVLGMPLLAEAQVVAGRQGMTNKVRWVHNAAVPDAPDWLNGGELVLTTMINLPQEREEQCQYVRAMASKDVAALGISVGRYIDRIPDHLRAVAEEHGFPLIEVPYQARFVDIAQVVNERISETNVEMVRRALRINQVLTQIVLEGGDLRRLAVKLAELVGHSISIETENFEGIAFENIAAVDEARRYTQLHGRTNPALVEALEQAGYLPRVREMLRPVHLPPMPEVGLEMERILAPVVVHGEIYGYMWIIADNHSISEIDMMAIEAGATIAALMILYQESVQTAEASLKGSLLSQLIQGDSTRETILTDQSLRYGVDLRSPFVMMMVDCSAGSTQRLVALYRTINQLITTAGWQAVAGQFAGQIVILMQNPADVRERAHQVLDRIDQRRGAPCSSRIGISGVHQGAQRVRVAHSQCQDVLHITRRLAPDKRVVYFDKLGYLHALYLAGPASLEANSCVPVLRRLLDEKQADLFATLEAYLDAGGNGVGTAEALHIHRSTLNYRLTRIAAICDVDLQDPAVRTDLQIALKLMRLFGTDRST